MRVVILAGGIGKRLEPYTTVLPKPLMPINDMPILEVIIKQLKYYDFTQITLAVGHLGGLIRAYCGDGSKFGIDIEYSQEDEPLGTAGPLSLIRNLNDSFLLMNGDILSDIDYRAMLCYHKEKKGIATLGTFTKKITLDLGVVKTDDSGLINQYIEKPTLENDISMGIYVFEPEVRKYIPVGQKLDLPDLITILIQNGEKVVGYRFNGYWLDIGRVDDYHDAIKLFQEKKSLFVH